MKYLFIIILFLTNIMLMANRDRAVIFSEDFELEPVGWTYGGTAPTWRWGAKTDFGSSQYWTFLDPHDGVKFMGINSDELGDGVICHDFLTTPVIDLSQYTNALISYNYCFADDGSNAFSDILILHYRTSEENPWVEIKNYDDVWMPTWDIENILLPEEALVSTVQFAFEYDDFSNWSYGGGVDNFILEGYLENRINSNPLLVSNYKLYQNFPNPFNPTTSISFTLNSAAYVELTVYDAQGAKVANLINESIKSGMSSVQFDGSNLSSGVYSYRLSVDGVFTTKKMILLK